MTLVRATLTFLLGRCGGQMFNMLAFNSDSPSLNPEESTAFDL